MWLYDSPFQVTVNHVGGGLTIVIDKNLRFRDAAEADVVRLLDSVRIVKCSTRGCQNPAFVPASTLKHRDGKCEPCALKAFSKEMEKAQLDRKHKARGSTHRVDAWVHADGGDQQVSIWICDPTEATIRTELLHAGVSDLQDHTLHQL